MCDLIRSTLVVAALLVGARNMAGMLRRVQIVLDDPQEPSSSFPPVVMARRRKRPSIVLLGDSLTQRSFGEDGHVGWGSLLAAAYTRRADVKERGFGGYNSHHALHVWPEVEEAYEDEMLFGTLFFGANDAVLPGHPQHVSMEEFQQNLEELIANIRKLQPSIPLFLFTPPPVDEAVWVGPSRRNQVTRSYGEVVQEVARQQPFVAVLDTWALLEGTNQTAYSQYLSDGLHLNELGNRRIYQGLMDLIHWEYPNLAPKTNNHPDGLPFLHKSWKLYE